MDVRNSAISGNQFKTILHDRSDEMFSKSQKNWKYIFEIVICSSYIFHVCVYFL